MADAAVLLNQLQEHLEEALNLDIDLDRKLLEECEVFLVPQLTQDSEKLLELISTASRLLLTLKHDPTPLTRLLERLVEPFSFSDVLKLQPPVDFVAGLGLLAAPFNDLFLTLIQKAAQSSRDAAVLASMPDVVHALILLWLASPRSGVADRAGSIILQLLAADKEASDVTMHGVGDDSANQHGGQGLIWRRVFHDKTIYRLFYSVTSLKGPDFPEMGKREKSLAQARLMSLLPKIGVLDWIYISSSHIQEVEKEFGLSTSANGLVEWAAVHMVDYKDDVLIYMNLLQFYGDLLSMISLPSPVDRVSSVTLDFLRSRGLHDRAASYWLHPEDPAHDPIEVQFLYSYSARYVALYLSSYPESFLASDKVTSTLQRLAQALDMSANTWAHGSSPAHDLHVLSSIPRIALLPTRALGTGRRSSPLFTIPCKGTNADALMTLGHIFRGPVVEVDTLDPAGKQRYRREAAAARALYSLYLAQHDTLYDDLLQHAGTVALPQLALASIQLISSIASARWGSLPGQPTSFSEGNTAATLDALPTENDLANMLPTSDSAVMGGQGIRALLQSPAREKVFPWLLRPPATYTHLVGGRGDPESSAYKIAMAKWDLLQLTQGQLRTMTVQGEDGGVQGLQDLQSALSARVAEGPWGSALEAGTRIGTLEL